MNTLEINGITFTSKAFKEFKDWLKTGVNDQDRLISEDIVTLRKAQSLIIINWETMADYNDLSIKDVVISLHHVIDRLISLSQINEKKISTICNQTSSDSN